MACPPNRCCCCPPLAGAGDAGWVPAQWVCCWWWQLQPAAAGVGGVPRAVQRPTQAAAPSIKCEGRWDARRLLYTLVSLRAVALACVLLVFVLGIHPCIIQETRGLSSTAHQLNHCNFKLNRPGPGTISNTSRKMVDLWLAEAPFCATSGPSCCCSRVPLSPSCHLA